MPDQVRTRHQESKHLRLAWWLWLFTLITIPVTSFPLVASFSGGETPVSPLALLPLLPVFILAVVPFFVSGGRLPAFVLPLLIFGLFTIISSAASVALPLFPFKDQTYFNRLIRGIITIGVGFAFYFSAFVLTNGEYQSKASIRALYLGLVLMLVWSSIQAWLVLDGSERVPLLVTRIHHIFSVRDPLGDRVTGMAFEPSWLGDQLVVLYLPLLFSSVIRRYSVFKFIWRKVSFEAVLLIWASIILFLTQSRISLLSLSVLVSAGYFYIGARYIRRVIVPTRKHNWRWFTWLLGILALLAGWVLLVVAIAWVLSQVDERLAFLLRIFTRFEEFAYFYPNEAGFALANQLAFAERIAYWTVGMRTFSVYPILGVGPGNLGFFFEQHLPAYALQLTELRNVLTQIEFGFPNAKNLWIRLLAEGGLLGFSSFLTWYLLIFMGTLMLWRNSRRTNGMLGLAGVVGAVTFFIEGFSLDTYALPQFWILFGLVSSSIARFWKRVPEEESPHAIDVAGENLGALRGINPDLTKD